jgi:hypothetical protein
MAQIIVVVWASVNVITLEMATQLDRSWCVLQLRKKESVTIVQRAFRTQFQMEPTSRVSTYAWYKKIEQKKCICKDKSRGWPSVSHSTAVGLASKAAQKNWSADLIFSCNYHKHPSPEFCLSVYLRNRTNFNCFRFWNQIWPQEKMTSFCADGRRHRQT